MGGMRKEPFVLLDDAVEYLSRKYNRSEGNVSGIIESYASDNIYFQERMQQGLFPLHDAQVLDLWMQGRSHTQMKKAPELGLEYRELSPENIITPQEFYLNFQGRKKWTTEEIVPPEDLAAGVYVNIDSLARMADLSKSFTFVKAKQLGLQVKRRDRAHFYFVDQQTLEILRERNSYPALEAAKLILSLPATTIIDPPEAEIVEVEELDGKKWIDDVVDSKIISVADPAEAVAMEPAIPYIETKTVSPQRELEPILSYSKTKPAEKARELIKRDYQRTKKREKDDEEDDTRKGRRRDLLALTFEEVKKYPLLTREEECRYGTIIREHQEKKGPEYEAAFDVMIKSNLRLVAKITYRYTGVSSHDFNDLFQEGYF